MTLPLRSISNYRNIDFLTNPTRKVVNDREVGGVVFSTLFNVCWVGGWSKYLIKKQLLFLELYNYKIKYRQPGTDLIYCVRVDEISEKLKTNKIQLHTNTWKHLFAYLNILFKLLGETIYFFKFLGFFNLLAYSTVKNTKNIVFCL